MSVIQKILDEETRWIAQQEGRVVSDMMDIYKGTLAEIRGEIKALDKFSYSHNHARAIQAQLEAKVATMRVKMSESMGRTMTKTYARAQVRERNALAKLEKAFGDAFMAHQYKGFTPVVPNRAIKKLITTQGIAIKGLSDEVTRDVRKLGVARSLVRGEGTDATVRRLQKMDLPLREGRVRLIARMETARSVNEAKSETLVQAAKEFGEDIWQMFKDHVERSAKTRNHWLSWALSGTVRNVTKKEYFEVHNAEIQATKAAYQQITRRSAKDSGILMDKFSKGLRTKGGVGHFWERGNIVPWKPKWGATFGAVKHPQGPIDGVEEAKKQPVTAQSSQINNSENKKQPTKIEQLQSRPKQRLTADEALEMKNTYVDEMTKINARAKQIENDLLNTMSSGNVDDLIIELEELDDREQLIISEIHSKIKSPVNADFNPVIRMRFKPDEQIFKRDIENGIRFISELIGPGKLDGFSFDIRRARGKRGRYVDGVLEVLRFENSVDTSGTVVHEIGHLIEQVFPGAVENAVKFWKGRTVGNVDESLRDLTGLDFDAHELTRKDEFPSVYMGKVYYRNRRPKNISAQKPYRLPGDPKDKIVATEIVSAGLEMLYKDPLSLMQDEDYFRFIWGLITDV